MNPRPHICKLIQRIQSLPPGTVIPKPKARGHFVIKGWGKRAGEDALIYFIPNHSDRSKPYQKGITVSEWAAAYDELMDEQKFSKQWFNANLKRGLERGRL